MARLITDPKGTVALWHLDAKVRGPAKIVQSTMRFNVGAGPDNRYHRHLADSG